MNVLKMDSFRRSADEKATNQVKQSMLAVLVLNWLFGLGVVEWPLGHEHYRLSRIYTGVIIVAYCTSVLKIYQYVLFTTFPSVTCSKPRKIIFCVKVVLTIGLILLSWYRRKGLHDFMKRICAIDNLMELINSSSLSGKKVTWFLTRKYVLFLVTLLFVIFFALVSVVGYDQATPKRTFALSMTCYSILTMFAVDTGFMYCINRTRYNFQLLNKVLKAMLTTTELTPQYKRLARSTTKIYVRGVDQCDVDRFDQSNSSDVCKIQLAKKIHGELMKLCDDAHYTYGLQILLSTFAAFTIITSYMFDIFIFFQVPYTLHVFVNLSNRIAWVFYHSFKVWIISSVCSDCKNEATKTGDIINELYDDPKIDNETRVEIRNFNIQLIEKPLKFTAYGVFPLDFTLIQVAVGTITTYLMLLRELHS